MVDIPKPGSNALGYVSTSISISDDTADQLMAIGKAEAITTVSGIIRHAVKFRYDRLAPQLKNRRKRKSHANTGIEA